MVESDYFTIPDGIVQDVKNILKNHITITSKGCWECNYAKETNGYTSVHYAGKKMLAHRVMYFLVNGKFPDKCLVLHTCDNRICVNPDHLYLGSYIDNRFDTLKRKGSLRLTVKQVTQIAKLLRENVLQHQAIADIFSVGRSTITNINSGTTWKWVTGLGR